MTYLATMRESCEQMTLEQKLGCIMDAIDNMEYNVDWAKDWIDGIDKTFDFDEFHFRLEIIEKKLGIKKETKNG